LSSKNKNSQEKKNRKRRSYKKEEERGRGRRECLKGRNIMSTKKTFVIPIAAESAAIVKDFAQGRCES